MLKCDGENFKFRNYFIITEPLKINEKYKNKKLIVRKKVNYKITLADTKIFLIKLIILKRWIFLYS